MSKISPSPSVVKDEFVEEAVRKHGFTYSGAIRAWKAIKKGIEDIRAGKVSPSPFTVKDGEG